MIFTQAEIICLNSMLDGENIFGTHFNVPEKPDSNYINSTFSSLHQKGLLDAKQQINRLFFAVSKMLEEYKKATTHVFINKARIALGKRFLVELAPIEKSYDITRVDKALYILALQKAVPALEQVSEIESNTKKLSIAKWNTLWAARSDVENFFMIQKIKNKNTLEVFSSLYRIDEFWFIYDMQKEELTTCDAKYISSYLLHVFEMPTSANLEEN